MFFVTFSAHFIFQEVKLTWLNLTIWKRKVQNMDITTIGMKRLVSSERIFGKIVEALKSSTHK